MEDANQYCPVAIATEILGDRWTPLILREFIVGAHTFGEIQSGIPRISRSLLAERLRQLVANGLITRTEEHAGRPRYSLTPAGEDLQDFVIGLGEWAIRWAYFSDPADDQLDNTHLMWRFRRGVLRDRVPERRVVETASKIVRKRWSAFSLARALLPSTSWRDNSSGRRLVSTSQHAVCVPSATARVTNRLRACASPDDRQPSETAKLISSNSGRSLSSNMRLGTTRSGCSQPSQARG